MRIAIRSKMCSSTTTDAMKLDKNTAIQTYAELFEKKGSHGVNIDSINHDFLQQLAGRMTRGSQESHFAYLQKDRSAKKFAWVMGDDGLTRFLTQSNLEALRSIGCEDQWIRKKLEDGEYFRLGIFPRSNECVLATWDGIFSLIDRHYSETISSKIRRQAQALKQTNYDEIEARARISYLGGCSYFDINEMGTDGYSTDPRFMSEERFSQCQGTLEECRGFLYNRMGLSRLFDGSGYTKDSNNHLIVREYLQPNVPVQNIPDFRYLNLPIDDTDLMPNA